MITSRLTRVRVPAQPGQYLFLLYCSDCNVVSNEWNDPTPRLVQHIGTYGGEVMYFGCFCFRGELGYLNCDDIGMYVVNKKFVLLEFVLIPCMLTCSMVRFLPLLPAGYVCLCGICSHVVVFGLSVRLSW